MKLTLVVMLLAVSAAAQQADVSFSQLAADKLKETRPVVLLSPSQKPAYAGFLPLHSFHSVYDKDASGKDIVDPYKDFLELGIGGKYETETKNGSGFAALDVNIVALASRIWSFPWAQSHVRNVKLPPIFLGGGWIAPLDWHGLKSMNAKRDVRAMASVIYKW